MPNKKAVIEDWLPLLLIIVVLLFFVSCTAIGNFNRHRIIDQAVTSQFIIKDSSQQLLNYLKSPIKLDNMNDANVADALNYYYLKKNDALLKQIKVATDDFFSKSSIETDYSSYSIEIKYPDDEILIESERSRMQQVLRKELVATIIPISNTDKIIQIKLFIVTTKFATK